MHMDDLVITDASSELEVDDGLNGTEPRPTNVAAAMPLERAGLFDDIGQTISAPFVRLPLNR